MIRMTARKADAALAAIDLCLASEDLDSADRERLVAAGNLVAQVRSRAFDIATARPSRWPRAKGRAS